MRPLVSLLLGLALPALLFSAELSGTVRNYADGSPLSGATIRISRLHLETLTNLDGNFILKDLPIGSHVVTVTLSGFHTYTFEHTVSNTQDSYHADIELKAYEPGESTAEVLQEQPRYGLPEVTVLTTRASADHPVTFSNLTRNDVQERNYAQDLPLLLTDLPNTTAYSDGANGTGYSYLRLRGFGQNRVAVQINGTPLNDAGTGEVFWIDLPDFASDVEDIQVQRGVGSSLYGAAAFGGTVNVVTRTPGLGDRPMIRAEGTYGRWNTRRAMVQFESGRIADRYGIAGRLTRMKTDGYREGSWADLWSYYLSAARFTKSHTSRILFYGGPEKTHLAYNGATREELAVDRRYNPITYPNENDNFFQPHYELHDEWRITDRVNLLNSLYLFRGDGYYDQWRPGKKLEEYFFNDEQQRVEVPFDTLFPSWYYVTDSLGVPIPDTLADGSVVYHVKRFDLLRRRNVSETDWGWIPRLTTEHGWGETTIGGELRLHNSHHEGIILWGNPIPVGASPDARYYDYRIQKRCFSGYIHNLLRPIPDLRVMLDLQAQSLRYEMDRDRLFDVTFDKTYSSVTPRLGAVYQILKAGPEVYQPALQAYANLSWAQREPTYKDVYDPQQFDYLPINDPIRFTPSGSGWIYSGPSLKPEKLTNLEVGANVQWSKARLGVNGYFMTIKDEIVPYGPLDDLGVPQTVNAEKTLHQGIESVGAWSPLEWLTLSGNLAVTDHHFVRYDELDSATYTTVKRDGNRLANDPPYIGNLRAEFRYAGAFLTLGWRAIGKQYVDNTENEATAVRACRLVNLDVGYRFTKLAGVAKAAEVRVRVNNVLDRKYEQYGFLDDNGNAVYIVGAPRAAYTTLAVEL